MYWILDKLSRAQGDISGVLGFGPKCGAWPCAHQALRCQARALAQNGRLDLDTEKLEEQSANSGIVRIELHQKGP